VVVFEAGGAAEEAGASAFLPIENKLGADPAADVGVWEAAPSLLPNKLGAGAADGVGAEGVGALV